MTTYAIVEVSSLFVYLDAIGINKVIDEIRSRETEFYLEILLENYTKIRMATGNSLGAVNQGHNLKPDLT